MSDLELDPIMASALCREAEDRLANRVRELDESVVRSPSLLPGWTVAHVLTHLARNADAHARRLAGALRGVAVAKYEGGQAQRVAEIEAGHDRPARIIIEDLLESQRRLGELFEQSNWAGWPNAEFRAGDSYGVGACPAHRLREVEVHHVDLGLGYTPADWPDEYVAWDLPVLLASVPERVSPASARTLMAWLAGRAPFDPEVALEPW